MPKNNTLTKILALVGTVFACVPVLAPLFFSLILLLRARLFRFDYLMPAEFFPVALLGGGLLLWAVLRVRRRFNLIYAVSIMIFLWLSMNGLAIATGLASGEAEPGGFGWVLVIISIILYTLDLIFIAVNGILLTRDLFKSLDKSTQTA